MMQTLILDAAGREFVKRVLKLYSSSKYPQGKELLADTFFQSAVDAGRLLSEIPVLLKQEDRRETALKAMDALNKTMFCIRILSETDTYSPRRTRPVCELAEEIENALSQIVPNRYAAPSDPSNEGDADGFNDDFTE